MTAEELRRMMGVDRLPVFADAEALRRSMARHHPPDLRAAGIGGSVLADVHIDAEGGVASVTVVPRPAGIRAAMVLQRADGSERVLHPTDDPAFGPAAEAALMDTRFTPAMRDGQPVPFTMRMTISFDQPSAAPDS
jgi:outer membrane biosynthesis protein TonB